MPFSTAKFKDETRELLIKKFQRDAKVLDVGPGSGIYADMLKDWFYEIDCIEVHPPYVKQFGLEYKYTEVYVGNITERVGLVNNYDIVIFGDVLEHLSIEAAKRILQFAEQQQCFVVVAVPYNYEQDEEMGNPYEKHLQPDLNPNVMEERYPQLTQYIGDETMGVYVFKSMASVTPLNGKELTTDDIRKELKDIAEKSLQHKELRTWIAYGIEIDHPKSQDQDITYVR